MVDQQWPDVWHAMPQKASSGPEFYSDHFILGLPLRHAGTSACACAWNPWMCQARGRHSSWPKHLVVATSESPLHSTMCSSCLWHGGERTEKEVYPKAADNNSACWSKHPCELSELVPQTCYASSSTALHQGRICKHGGLQRSQGSLCMPLGCQATA